MEALFLVLASIGLVAVIAMFVFMALGREMLVDISYLVATRYFGLLVLLAIINQIINQIILS